MKKRIMPPTYFWILLLLSIGVHFGLIFLFDLKKIIPSQYTIIEIIFGIILIILGIVFNIWADFLFKKERTTVKPHEKPSKLIVSGPFRFSRHPMYLGMAMILFGLAFLLGSLIVFIFPIIFMILMELLFISIEEKNLEKIFINKYIDYKKQVRRWI